MTLSEVGPRKQAVTLVRLVLGSRSGSNNISLAASGIDRQIN